MIENSDVVEGESVVVVGEEAVVEVVVVVRQLWTPVPYISSVDSS